MDYANIIAAAQRQHLAFFLMKVFEALHPGEPPLQLSWYLKAMCHALEEVKAGKTRRLVITVPPRHLKSITTSVAYVAWLLGHDPLLKIMVASYSQDLGRLHSENTRTILESGWYRRLFPRTRIRTPGNRQLEFGTTNGGFRKSVSVGGSVTGHGADLIIVDDLMKADDCHSQAARDEARRWYDDTLATRLNDKANGSIISIQQRLHEDDLPAHLLEKGYKHLNLPARGETDEKIPIGGGEVHRRLPGDLLSPEREGDEVLQQLRQDLGPQVYSAQYQQNPVAPEGNLIRLEWFGRYEEQPERSFFHKIVQSWDTASGEGPRSDYSVCTTWGYREGDWWLLDVLRKRLAYPDLKRAVIGQRRTWRADRVIIEEANSGISLWQELRVEGPFTPRLCRPTVDKATRLIGQTGQLETGRFHLPVEAPWLDTFCSELKAFPAGRYDDQVDSMTQFLEHSLLHWRWVEQDFTPEGRPISIIRNKRPLTSRWADHSA